MKAVMYGGSFDPISQAHVEIIKMLADRYDFVYVIPTNVEGYKPNAKMFSFGERCKKVKEAVKEMDNVIVSYVEEHVPENYQFVDTAKFYYNELVKGEKDAELYFAMGSDSFATFKTWDGWEEILKWCKITVINRDGDYKLPDDIPYDFIDYHNNSSSTKIRQVVENQMRNYVSVVDPLTELLKIDEFNNYCKRQGCLNSIENYVRYMNQNCYSLDLKELLSKITV